MLIFFFSAFTIIWGRWNGFGFPPSTLSCPVRHPLLPPDFPDMFYNKFSVFSFLVLVHLPFLARAMSLVMSVSDGIDGFMSDHIIHASDKFCVIVGMLINAMLTHGHNPSQLLNIVVKSIPKDMRGSLHSSNNYRGISLCNALCKVIDLIIIEKCDGYLYTSELQFAYKRDHSTMLCTAVFKETVSHFLENGSNVYACLLDASSAFDRVHYGKLFDVLMKRNMPAVFIRLLLDSYLNQRICAAWGACKSDFFQATNGVKQGSIISPILFTVYVDELIARLQASGLGCNIGRS